MNLHGVNGTPLTREAVLGYDALARANLGEYVRIDGRTVVVPTVLVISRAALADVGLTDCDVPNLCVVDE